jgi:simple sugar transport system permease protein
MRGSRDVLRRAVVPALALVTAFLFGAVLIILTDFDHLKDLGTDPVGALGGAVDVVIRGYGAMVTRAIGDPGRILTALQSGSARDIGAAMRPLTEALLFSTPLIFVTLGVGVAFHAGLFNLGTDGQFALGGLGAAAVAVTLAGSVPPPAILVAAVVGGAVFGGAWAFLPGLLKARTGAHELITTLMLNTIAAQLIIYVLRSTPFGRPLAPITSVPRIFDLPTVRLDWGFVLGLVMAVVVSFVLFRTTLGFELRSTGFSRSSARAAGMRPGRAITLAMSLSGALAGMGGALLTLGPGGGVSGLGPFGLVALGLVLIAGLRPSGIVLVVLLYGALNNGAKGMVIETGVPLDLLVVVIAVALMFVAAPSLTRSMWRLGPEPMPAMATASSGVRPPGPPDPMSGA